MNLKIEFKIPSSKLDIAKEYFLNHQAKIIESSRCESLEATNEELDDIDMNTKLEAIKISTETCQSNFDNLNEITTEPLKIINKKLNTKNNQVSYKSFEESINKKN